MFSGIVDHCGIIKTIEIINNGKRFWIECQWNDFDKGESIAIDGMCLTVVQFEPQLFCCDLSPETLRLTTAQYLKVGDFVNLERALRLTDRIGGHFVTGHIDQLCEVSHVQQQGEFTAIDFHRVQKTSMSYLVKKGSVAVNGVSLTLNQVNTNGFQVMLIPHTLQRTNLSHLKIGSFVNVEYDYLAKIIVNHNSVVENA